MIKKSVLILFILLGILLIQSCTSMEEGDRTTGDEFDRTILPIKEPKRPTYTELDARNVQPPARFEVKAPEGAPNVLVILIDDMGFGVSEAFGGPITTPTMDKLAQNGLKYNRFHTTAVCSPTRVAVLTGTTITAIIWVLLLKLLRPFLEIQV